MLHATDSATTEQAENQASTNFEDSSKVTSVQRCTATARQLAVLRLIANSIRANGGAPSFIEIGKAMSVQSTNGVADHVRALERKGLLSRTEREARSLRITRQGFAALGDVAASSVAPIGVIPKKEPKPKKPLPPVPWWLEGTIYVIHAVGSDRVKIGFTRGRVEQRRLQLQTACPFPLSIVSTLPGSISREMALHRRFRASRVQNLEWFVLSPELQEFIDQHPRKVD